MPGEAELLAQAIATENQSGSGNNSNSSNSTSTLNSIIAYAGKLYDEVKGLFGTGTPHLSWNDADKIARPFADKVTQEIVNKFTGTFTDGDKLNNFQRDLTNRAILFYTDSGLWEATTAQLYARDTALTISGSEASKSAQEKLWLVIWRLTHWVYENIDANHLDTATSTFLPFVFSGTLIPTLETYGINSLSLPTISAVSSGTSTTTTTPVTQKPNTLSSIFGSGSIGTWVLISAILGFLIYNFVKRS